jgi:5'-nucleotidase / UDP-sugar diphosphatase
MRIKLLLGWMLLVGLSACQTGNVSKAPSHIVSFNLLQFNDVYELTPTNGMGGFARLATLKNRIKTQNPNTYTVLAGDYFSPSAMGTAKVDGERLSGKQMVAVLNAVGIDYATFGNHEFDVKDKEFASRLSEQKFQMISANVLDPQSKPFANTPPSVIWEVKNAAGKSIKVGMFSVTLDTNPVAYAKLDDYYSAASAQVKVLRPQVDVLIAMTHLAIDQDLRLAQGLPEIDLIMGGHEHENIIMRRGLNLTPIAKADANLHTVYVHNFEVDADTKQFKLKHDLIPLDSSIPADPAIETVVNEWVNKAYDGFRKDGFEPTNLVATTSEALDGLETSVRNRPTNLTQVIANGMKDVVPDAVCSIFNGGSIRIDDVIPAGKLTEYDIIRILPFGGEVVSVTMTGKLLVQVLNQGVANRGKGGYLQHASINPSKDYGWLVDGSPIEDDKIYNIAISDFLVTGKERGLEFLNPQNPDLKIVAKHGDVRKALIARMKAVYGK